MGVVKEIEQWGNSDINIMQVDENLDHCGNPAHHTIASSISIQAEVTIDNSIIRKENELLGSPYTQNALDYDNNDITLPQCDEEAERLSSPRINSSNYEQEYKTLIIQCDYPCHDFPQDSSLNFSPNGAGFNTTDAALKSTGKRRVLKTDSCPDCRNMKSNINGKSWTHSNVSCIFVGPCNRNGSNGVEQRTDNRTLAVTDRAQYSSYHQGTMTKGKACCPTASRMMIAVITVLILVIVGLASGLIFFVVFESTENQAATTPEIVVPPSSAVMNQTSVCGKVASEFLSRNPFARQSSITLPPVADYQLNGSAESQDFSSVSASIVFNPVQVTPSSSKSSYSDKSSKVQGRIYGGKKVAATRFPWQVSLWVKNQGMKCGGALIMHNWVITAAHCTDKNLDASTWTVYVGMTHMSKRLKYPAQQSKVIEIIQHRDYVDNFSYDYDVSLLKLTKSIQFSASIQPICLPSMSSPDFKDGTKCFISGWGATINTGEKNSPNTLQHAQVDIIGYGTCRKPDWLDMLVTDRMICAGKADGSSDACQGDSGGPLSCYDNDRNAWTLAGIVSWGIGCGQPKHPGVYAKMTFFVEWVWRRIGENEGWMEASGDDRI